MIGSKYHKVYSRLWTNEFRSWDDDARLLALYLLTCPHRNTEGLFRLPLPLVQHDLGWDETRAPAAIESLRTAGFVDIDADADLVWLVDALKWDQPKGPKQIKGAVNALAEVPPSPLRDRYLERCTSLCPDLASAIQDTLDWTRYPFEGVSQDSGRGIPGQPDTPSNAHTPPPALAPPPQPPAFDLTMTVAERLGTNVDRLLRCGIAGALVRAKGAGWADHAITETAAIAATKTHPFAWLAKTLEVAEPPDARYSTADEFAALFARLDAAAAKATA